MTHCHAILIIAEKAAVVLEANRVQVHLLTAQIRIAFAGRTIRVRPVGGIVCVFLDCLETRPRRRLHEQLSLDSGRCVICGGEGGACALRSNEALTREVEEDHLHELDHAEYPHCLRHVGRGFCERLENCQQRSAQLGKARVHIFESVGGKMLEVDEL